MIQSLPHLLYHQGLYYSETIAQLSKDYSGNFQPTTYFELLNQTFDFAAGLVSIGTKKGEHIGHISDDRQEWQSISLGAMSIGCADIPRGTDVTVRELTYILGFTDCRTVCVENPFVLGKICQCLPDLPYLENIILVDSQNQNLEKYDLQGKKLYHYSNLLIIGGKWRDEHPDKIEEMMRQVQPDDVATIIFTSGTTGTPKGVQLTHHNFLLQLPALHERLDFHRGDRAMCILPVWHVYERVFEFYMMYFAGTLCYSKPVASVLLTDMKKVRPQMMPCVPRVWEAIYQTISKKIQKASKISWILFKFLESVSSGSQGMKDCIKGLNRTYKHTPIILRGIQKLLWIPYGILYPLRILGNKLYFASIKEILGGRFIVGISGGGGFPPKLDRFFNSVGIQIVEGYGMTETAPMVALRDRFAPVLCTIGNPLPYEEVKLVNDEGKLVKPGEKGLLYVRGENVMKGYYNQPELTATILDEEGWLNTGDLAVQTFRGQLMIKGRKKDTIVLKNGENVEPFPIEAKLIESKYIQKAVVVGQDENNLGALVVPNIDPLKASAIAANIPHAENTAKLLASDFARELITREMERLICTKNGFKNFERIATFEFLEKFEHPEEEFSAKGELVRYKVCENYAGLIRKMFNKEKKKVQRLQDFIQNLLD